MIKTLQKIQEIFNRWNFWKQKIHLQNIRPYFKEREIRWACLGQNIGSESFGKGEMFARPVVILEKVYGNSAIVLPLTSQVKKGSYYHLLKDSKNKKHCALLAQVRYIDGKRLKEKISIISKSELKKLLKAYFTLIQK